MATSLRIRILGLCLAIALTACGGGGGGGGGGGLASGGVGGSGISQGSVSGFGSILVNGTVWNTDSASFEIDGVAGSEADLDVGRVVTVEGSFDAGGATGTATRVVFDDSIEGPVAAVVDIGNDGVFRELTVLDQTVVVERNVTVFDGPMGFDFDTVAVNDVLEVSGFVDDMGVIQATFVEKRGTLVLGVTTVELEGVVANFAGGSTFTLGGVTVTFDPAGILTDLSELPGGVVANGLAVEVEGVQVGAAAVDATRIEPQDELDDDADEVRLEGFIDDFAGLASFTVSGQPVDASAAALDPNDPAVFGDGARVLVEGELVGGVLVADELELRDRDVRVEAELAPGSVNLGAESFVLLGVTVLTDASTQFEDARDELPNFGLADFAAGDFLAVRGFADGMGNVVATEIERDNADDITLEGPVDAFDAPGRTLTILGVVVPVDDNTEFENEVDAAVTEAAFFASLMAGDVVAAMDEAGDGDDTAIDVANEVEVED
ncbi:MAG: DUF5666 domain-containing protein [Proteobacteria bacterium]|nr:DUF5666 domain-containing protein [Pseudomonadota bacterium]